MDKKIFNEIMRDYERTRQKNNKILMEKKRSLYKLEPRLLEIENKITELSLKISKLILNQKQDNTEAKEFFLQKENLIKEKQKILEEMDLSKDCFYIYSCPVCKDTGYIKNKRCNCFEQKIIEKYYDMSGLRDILSKENFDTFDLRLYSKEKKPESSKSPYEFAQIAYDTSYNFIKKFESEFNNILFYGKTGVGKTFLCNCIAKSILDKAHTVLYLTASQLCEKLEKIRFDKTNNNKEDNSGSRKMIFESDLLIIDDLGSEHMNVLYQSELFHVINSRLVLRKSVVCSTNLSLEELQEQYSDRIVSRIIKNYELINLIGEDMRLKTFEEKKAKEKKAKN